MKSQYVVLLLKLLSLEKSAGAATMDILMLGLDGVMVCPMPVSD